MQRRQELEQQQPAAKLSSWGSGPSEQSFSPVAAVDLPLGSRADEPPLVPVVASPDAPAVPRRSQRLADKTTARPVELVCCQAHLEPPAPRTYWEAMTEAPDKWRMAMDSERQMLTALGTWTLTDLPPDASAIGVKWVFRRKWDGSGYGT